MGKTSRKKRFLQRRRSRRNDDRIEFRVESKRIAVLTPACDLCHTDFHQSMVEMMMATVLAAPEGIEGIASQTYGSSLIPFSRKILAEYAIKNGMTHMLWIDSDMKFPADTIMRLARHDKPIVGINAMSRRPPFRCTAQSSPGQPLVTRPDSTGLEKVERMGFGLVWIATEVFRQIDEPWFATQWLPDRGVYQGEDYYFFEKARAAGYECFVDHDLSKLVGHVGTFRYNPLLSNFQEVSA